MLENSHGRRCSGAARRAPANDAATATARTPSYSRISVVRENGTTTKTDAPKAPITRSALQPAPNPGRCGRMPSAIGRTSARLSLLRLPAPRGIGSLVAPFLSGRTENPRSRERGENRWHCSLVTQHPISRQRRPRGRFTSTSGWATHGPCSSRTRRTSPISTVLCILLRSFLVLLLSATPPQAVAALADQGKKDARLYHIIVRRQAFPTGRVESATEVTWPRESTAAARVQCTVRVRCAVNCYCSTRPATGAYCVNGDEIVLNVLMSMWRSTARYRRM